MRERRADFDRFVAGSTDTLLSAAYLIVGGLGEAHGLVQDTLFEIARRWPRVRRMEHPVAYARRILVNRAVGGAPRHARRRGELVADAPPERAGPSIESEGLGAHDEPITRLAAMP